MSTKSSFTFVWSNTRKLLYIPGYLVGLLLSLVIWRRKNTWAIGSGAGVGEGALAVARELHQSHPEQTLVWIAENEHEQQLARAEGFETQLKHSWAGFWATLRARTIVVTHGLGDVHRFGIFRATIVNLWHGAPIKQLHFDSPVTTQLAAGGIFSRILSAMYRVGAGQVDVYAAGSIVAAERLRSAFRVLPGVVQVLGDARLDTLKANLERGAHSREDRVKLAELCGLRSTASASKWVLYAPTWRDGGANVGMPNRDEVALLQRWAERVNTTLFIRAHHMTDEDLDLSGAERIIALPSSIVTDITPSLSLFDAVVTDYSSIAIDFSLTGRPIVWFAPDLESYESSRGLYEPYAVTTEGHYTDSWEATSERLTAVLAEGSGSQRAAMMRTQRLAARFHGGEHGAAAPRVIEYVAQLHEPVHSTERTPGVFFESFYGSSVTCNPLALDREIASRYPHLTRYWSVDSERITVPAGAVPVLVGSPAWHRVRSSVPLLIVNDWLRFGFSRKKHQVVLQTWHGTPLKNLALDRPHVSLRTRVAVRRESRRWSVLLSQNAHSSKVLPRSYRFRGPVVETGYPRNDRLARSVHLGERLGAPRMSARHRLGLSPERNVLLYAPTWRDAQQGTVDLLGVAELAQQLGEDWVILARGHSRDAPVAHYTGARVVDVSRGHDINELIIAADVLITDYSSVMFDASVACVPTIAHMPDLAEYRDAERGFTFDVLATPPGPIVTSQHEVVPLLREYAAQGAHAQWLVDAEQQRAAWRARFNSHDDGDAATRVLDWLLEHQPAALCTQTESSNDSATLAQT